MFLKSPGGGVPPGSQCPPRLQRRLWTMTAAWGRRELQEPQFRTTETRLSHSRMQLSCEWVFGRAAAAEKPSEMVRPFS
jgi:hypothetical protein